METIDYTEILVEIKTILGAINVYCWGILAWNLITHIRNRRDTNERRK